MAKLSISVPDDIVEDLRALATDNVSAFVATAIRHEVDRRRLFGFLAELEDDLGPADEDEVAAYIEQFMRLAPRARAGGTRRPTRPKRQPSAS